MSLRLYNQLQPIWVESSEFFQVPEHLYKEDSYIRRLAPRFARCFAPLSPGSNRKSEARNFSKSKGIHLGKRLYTTTRTSLRSVLCSTAAQIQYRLYGGRVRNFSKFQSIYIERQLPIYEDSQLASLDTLLFQVPDLKERVSLGFLPSPRAYMGEQDPIYQHISSHSIIISTFFFIFPAYSFIFLHIFLLIFYILPYIEGER